MKVLLIDDSELNNIFLGRLLKKLGHDVSSCLSGKDALSLIKTGPMPQVIFLDWMMPDLDGLALLPKIRKLAGEGEVFIVMVTSRSEENDRTEALNAGADIHLSKPLRVDELVSTMKIAQDTLNERRAEEGPKAKKEA